MAAESDDHAGSRTPRRPGRPPRIARRTIVVCVLVAIVAAAASGGVAAAVLSRDDRPRLDLADAASVSDHIGFTRLDGTHDTLADYDGQPLVVNFFASSCVPCRKEMPALEKVQRAAGDHVTVLGIAVQDESAAAADLVKRTGVTYDIGLDDTGKLFNASGGTVLPFTIFVSADGTIMERHTGALTEAQLKDRISVNLLAGG